MAHNKLRRDLADALKSDCPDLKNTAVRSLLTRAWLALGGPVENTRDESPNMGLYQALDGTPPRDEAPGLGDVPGPEVKHLFGIPALMLPVGRVDLPPSPNCHIDGIGLPEHLVIVGQDDPASKVLFETGRDLDDETSYHPGCQGD